MERVYGDTKRYGQRRDAQMPADVRDDLRTMGDALVKASGGREVKRETLWLPYRRESDAAGAVKVTVETDE